MRDSTRRVMVITAHPDDSEFGAGGTVAKLTREGKTVIYCILTNGNKGSSDRSMTPERLVGIREDGRQVSRNLGLHVHLPQAGQGFQEFDRPGEDWAHGDWTNRGAPGPGVFQELADDPADPLDLVQDSRHVP